MTAALLTPVTTDLAVAVGPRTFRKQLLPIKSIDYKGRRLDFSRDYLAELAKSFRDRAYDSVKFFLADKDNAHTVDPERMRGTIKALELSDDGLDAVVEFATDEAAALVRDHPDLGVSARIVPNLVKSDGRKFPAAVQHVLGTVDPVVTGMKPWAAVDLSEETTDSDVDLTSATFNEGTWAMPELDEAKQKRLDTLLGLLDEQFNTLVAPPASTESSNEPTEQEVAEALAALETEANEPAEATLSAEVQQALDLANSRAENAEATARESARLVARAEWTAEAQALLAAGVPKADIDLAAPWCGGDAPEGFIDLSNADTTVETVKAAAADTIRKLLGVRKGTIDMSVIGETPDSDADTEKQRRQAASEYAKHAGIVG